MKEEIKNIIESTIPQRFIREGNNYKGRIELVKHGLTMNGENFYFKVAPEYGYYYENVLINIKNKEINYMRCECMDYYRNRMCNHISACILKYSDEIFKLSFETPEEKAKRIMTMLKSKIVNYSPKKKEEVFLIPSISITNNSYYDETYTSLKVKIGIDKKYSLTNKFRSFMNAYMNNESFNFAKNFTFDPDCHYFSEQGKKIIYYLKSLDITGREIILNSRELDDLLEITNNKIFVEEFKEELEIKDEFPFKTILSKNNNKYNLNIKKDMLDFIALTEDYKYIFYENNIYRLNPSQRLLLQSCIVEEIENLSFNEEDFNFFQESLIPVIKEKIETDETTKDIIIINKPKIRLYFDILEDCITCIPKFLINSNEISFFDKQDNIINNDDINNEIEEYLYSYNFEKGKNNFVLTELEDICELIDKGFNEISKEYEVFTSEKLKNTNIIKNNTISSSFSIGKDNILRYTFDLGEINEKELKNIMKSINSNKKYYKLKSGDIISLEEESIKELHDLTEELDLGNNFNLKGEIPKYRALYLDFLKENKYGIIKTDSLFQNFINQFNEYKNNDLKLTDKEKEILRDYQEEGVKWLYTIKKCGFGGILADEMGLGKSIQTIYFIKKILEENPESKHLIICPTSLVYNWENEFKKFAPDLNFKVFASNKNTRINELQNYQENIYITTYGLLREDLEYYKNINFEICVIDEAQNIKNPKTGLTKAVKEVNAVTKIALTGTPIENSIVELWSIFDYMMPGFLSNLMAFQKKYKIKDLTDEKDNNTIDILKKQVKPFILRRKKKDVIKDLPDKIENNIYIDLNEEQKKIYASEVKYVQEELDNIINTGDFNKNRILILKLLTRLRQVCIDPSIIHKDYTGSSSKIETLIKTIKEVTDNGHKVLLFTSFKTALEIVKKELDNEDISNFTIAGDVNSKTRQKLVDSFNKDNTKVFLIMLKSGGTGLNLTSADIVIHLDLWWNPQVENQATDRAHRIGQKNTVEVIKLICKGTIEERILELQDKKKLLSEKLLEKDMDDSKYLNQLNEEDIKNLITYNND